MMDFVKYAPVTVTQMQIVVLAYVVHRGVLEILCQVVLLQRVPTSKLFQVIIVSRKMIDITVLLYVLTMIQV